MTRVQKYQLKLSELRQKMGAMLDNEERAEAWQADLDSLKAELQATESELQASFLIEPQPTETRVSEDGEGAELRRARTVGA